MANRKPMPTPETIRDLLDYDKETGKFVWKERALSYFPAVRFQKIWNTRFAGKDALCTLAYNGYLYGAIFGDNYSSHRVAWLHATGEEPVEIDHINGDRTDNRLANLREVNRQENCKNTSRGSRNSSGVIGVTWDKDNSKWHATIQGDYIGRFSLFKDAVAARKAAEVERNFHPNHGREAVN